MIEERLDTLRRELERDPHRVELWTDLARLAARTRRVPDFLNIFHLPVLLEVWQGVSGNRHLNALFLALLGLEQVSDPDADPGTWWREAGRLGAAEDHHYDTESGLPLRVRRRQDDAEMCLVPGGVFLMGADHGAPDERPSREVHVDAFYLDRHEVTVARFERYLAATRARAPDHWEEQLERPGRPVIQINWFEAAAYTSWVGGRLPSEDEWEKAARGTDGRAYPWGAEPPDPTRARYEEDPAATDQTGSEREREIKERWDERTAEVGSFPAGRSPFGVEDMCGNVGEWSGDSYAADYYARAPRRNPRGPASAAETRRTIRSPHWRCTLDLLHVARRSRSDPRFRSHLVGMRVALPLHPDAR